MAVSRLSQTSLQNAFQKYNNVWDGRSAVGSMDAIATYTVGASSVSNITFSSIPATYTHLQLRAMTRMTRSGQNGAASAIQLNGDTVTTYYRSFVLEGTNTTVSPGYYTDAGPSIYGIRALDATGTNSANFFGPTILDIADYTNTNKKKTLKSLTGYDSTSATDKDLRLYGGIWLQTSAINQIKIIPCYGSAFEPYSTFALYGIK